MWSHKLKRPYPTDSHTKSHPNPKRPRPSHATTAATFAAICDKNAAALDLSVEQFTTLCAYLCTLLRWGLRINTSDLDDFITLYSHFRAERVKFEERQILNTAVTIPSYHQWFLQQRRGLGMTINRHVLDEKTLRLIWAENLYTFLLVHTSLESIAKSNSIVLTQQHHYTVSKRR